MAQITGTSGNDRLVGTAGADTMNGLGGNDTIVGGSGGADVIDGGTGFDTIEFGSAAPSAVIVDFRNGTITGGGTGSISFTSIERVVGSNFNDVLTGNAAGQNLTGQAGADTLWGAGGVDTLWGGGGAGDTFIFRETGTANADLISDFTSGVDKIQLDATVMTALGASGNFAAGDARFWAAAGATGGHDADDRIIYDSTTRKIYYDPDGSGPAAAQLIATLQSGATLVATDIVVEGGSSGQVINGTAGNDSLVGGPGDDTINGFGGNDTLDGGVGNDTLDGGAGDDYLRGGIDVDRIGEGADLLIGGDGNDTLDGWSNDDHTRADVDADTLDGGLGNDVFMVDNPNDVLRDAGGIDTVLVRTGGWTLGPGFENLIIFDQEDGPGLSRGNELDNVMESRAWEAILEGMGGNDLLMVTGWSGGRTQTLRGGDGNDTLIGALGTTHESLDGGAGNDSLVGGAMTGDSVLTGGDGNDTLVAGGSFNEMTGGAGADRFVLASADSSFYLVRDFLSGSDRIVFDGNAFASTGASGDFITGDARFYAAAGATGAHDASDRIIFNTSTGDLYYDPDGIGSDAAQRIGVVTGTLAATDITIINGSAGGQVLNGTAGNDTLVGGPGNDTLNGLGGNDWIYGDQGDDSMLGGAGNDTLIGGSGNDTFDGGLGNDLLSSRAVDSSTRDLGQAERYFGGDGNDTIIGSSLDTMDGGAGDDRYEVWDTQGGLSPTIIDLAGNDTVVAVIMDFTLPGGIENLFAAQDPSGGSGQGHTLIGNDLNNLIDARGAENGCVVDGRAGNDTLIGHESGNDSLAGNEGADSLIGAAGNDSLSGGTGSDSFVFAETGTASADLITDFGSGIDTIQLDGNAYANSGASGRFAAGDARFTANSTGTAQDASDRVIYNTTTRQIFYDADGSGGGAAQLVATLQSGATLVATDIEVINGSGGSGGQVINGTAGNDTLIGGAGNDTINGFAGNDSLDGGEGADYLVGGEGNDTLFNPDFGHGDGSADTLDGGLGDDIYYVSDIWTDGDVILADPGGVDTVIARNTDWTLGAGLNNLDLNDSVGSAFNGTGNELDNVIRSASEGGTLSGMGGNDLLIARHAQNTVRLQGGDGNDTLDGGGNHTVMFGDAGNDSLTGSHVEDELDGGAGVDTMNGGEGDDLYTVTAGDVLSDSGGIDAVRTDVNWSLGADFEHLTMTGTASIQMQGNNSDNFVAGNSGNNYFNARAGSDTIQAGGGNDSIDMSSSGTGNHGNDVVDGGAGFDNIDYDGYATRGIIANWNTGTISGGDAVGSTVSFTSVEAIIGGAFADQMTGNASGQNLTGKGGNDTLWGAGGADTLWGGTGADSFVFREMGTANADRIGDFASASDKIALDDAAFTAIGGAGNFAAGDGRFWAAAGATAGHDANDRVVYNTSTGSLYYDADGSGAGAAQLIATFSGNPGVAATDITVI